MAPEPTTHPLADAPATAGLTLLGVCGVGWGLVSALVIAPGLLLSFGGALATLWLYWDEVRTLRPADLAPARFAKLRKSAVIALGILATELLAPLGVYLALPPYVGATPSNAGSAVASFATAPWLVSGVGGVIVAALVLLYRWEKRHPVVAYAAPAPHTTVAQPSLPAVQVPKKVEAQRVIPLTGSQNIEVSCDIEGWEKFFRVSVDKREVTLRFFPDTGSEKRNDAILLIVFGYKRILKANRVHQNYVHTALYDMLRNAPGTPLSPFERLMHVIPNNEYDHGKKLIDDRLLGRDGLAKGGYYFITDEGEDRAHQIAVDSIERA